MIAALGIAASVVTGIIGGAAAKKAKRAAARETKRLTANLVGKNPASNIFAITPVIPLCFALANTLDTLMATGSGAGGATALAQAAKQSKKEVSASIEQQEVSNEKMRAQGEADLEQRKIAEQQRIEGIQMSQTEKVQTAEAQGAQFVFNATENREDAKIDRVATQLDNAQAQIAQAQADGTAAITGAIGGIANAFTPSSTNQQLLDTGMSQDSIDNMVAGFDVFSGN